MENRIDHMLSVYMKLFKEQDDVYRLAAAKAGLSDAAYWTMYQLRDCKEEVTQSSLCKEWFFSKQTINSAVSGLVKKGYVTLNREKTKGNKKVLALTPEGEQFCDQFVDPLIRAERGSFEVLSEEEQDQFIYLMRKQLEAFKKGMEYARD